MSHNTQTELEIKDKGCLVKALQDVLGLTAEEIEVHDTPVKIKAYNGTQMLAHVVIRKAALKRTIGSAWADCGFHIEGSKATFNHDDLDTGLSKAYGKILGQYARQTTLKSAKLLGRRVTEVVENGKLRIRVEK